MFITMVLSNDPDKNCSIFYCFAAIRFPHVETVAFSDEEFINRWKAGLWNKMYLNSILKGSFLCVKTFQPITTAVNRQLKLPTFQCSPHRITVVFRLRRDFVERKIVAQWKINKYTAAWSFGRFCWLSQSEVW